MKKIERLLKLKYSIAANVSALRREMYQIEKDLKKCILLKNKSTKVESKNSQPKKLSKKLKTS